MMIFHRMNGSPADDDEPSPLPHGNVLSKLSLSNLDELSLVKLLPVDSTTDPLEHLTLKIAEKAKHDIVSALLKEGKGTSPEEDESVSQPVAFSGELDLVHEGVGGDLVV